MPELRGKRLIDVRMEALFKHDHEDRMCRINERDGGAAPRFFYGKTIEGNVWRFRDDIPKDLIEELEVLCVDESVGGEIGRRPRGSEAFIRLLEQHAPVQKVWAGPVFSFPERLDVSGHTVAITQENAAVLRPGFDDWLGDVEYRQPFRAALDGNRAVSVCCSVRITPKVHEAGVETLELKRDRGHGTCVVASWAAAVRALGCIPMYSTSWENAPSLGVARKLGLIQFGIDFHVT